MHAMRTVRGGEGACAQIEGVTGKLLTRRRMAWRGRDEYATADAFGGRARHAMSRETAALEVGVEVVAVHHVRRRCRLLVALERHAVAAD